jgi:hypothetical protein
MLDIYMIYICISAKAAPPLSEKLQQNNRKWIESLIKSESESESESMIIVLINQPLRSY